MNASAFSQAVSARRQPTRAIDPGGDDQDTQAAGEPTQFLTFSLNGEMFAVGIDNIKEIIEFGQPTEVPMMPGFIRGVINLRGAVVPVIDLNARFGRTASAVSRRCGIGSARDTGSGDRAAPFVRLAHPQRVPAGDGQGQRPVRDDPEHRPRVVGR